MSSTSTGRQAEQAAANYLENLFGLKVIDFNWRTRFCEIDIVASSASGLMKRSKTIHFIEVKYRKNSNYGDGLEYITNKKLKQMQFAAEVWVSENEWSGDYRIDAIGVTGSDDNWKFDYRPDISI